MPLRPSSNSFEYLQHTKILPVRVFQIPVRGRRGIGNFTGGGGLQGEGNLRRSDFDDLNLSQS